MDRQHPGLQLVIVVALMACGCTSSPWSAKTSGSSSPPLPHSETATPQATANTASPGATPQPGIPTEQAELNAMMAEVDRMQVLDAASRERLLQDLRQTEPRLRPLVFQQFRAAMAYRRQAEQREASLAAKPAEEFTAKKSVVPDRPAAEANQAPLTPPNQAQAAPAPAGVRVVSSEPPQSPADNLNRDPSAPSNVRPPDISPAAALMAASAMVPMAQSRGASLIPSLTPIANLAPAVIPATAIAPVTSPAPDSRPGPDRTAPNERPAASDAPERVEFPGAKPLPGRTDNAPSGCVPATALLPATQSSEDWRAHAAATIRAMESSVPKTPQSADDIAQHARLRMLYLLAGRRDDALRPIPAVPTTMQDVQDFWGNELYGLAVWLDTQRITDPRRRAEEAKRHLEKAVTRLSEMAPLMVRNLTFVTEIQSFGNYKPCPKTEFAPEEAMLLYAEVDNLKSEETPKGYHTAWRSSYRIFDHRGQMVADHEPTASEEYCQNLRHDFFIGCQFRLPKRIYPGKHTLHLTVEDVKSQKTGESSIEFTVKQLAE